MQMQPLTDSAPEASYHYCDAVTHLPSVWAQFDQAQRIALDTEFDKSRSFYPHLGLVQLNIAQQITILDGQRLPLDALWQRLAQCPQLFLHACSEDIGLIYHYARLTQPDFAPLTNVFDTQVALAFLGEGLQVSYQQAVARWLGVEIDKGETRSDWINRPLRPEQLRYAAADVQWLPALAERLEQALITQGHQAKVLEDCRSLAEELAIQPEPTALWRTVAHPRYNRRQLAQLQQLTMWRDQLARVLDTPRSFILKDAVIHALVQQVPHHLAALRKVPELKATVCRDYGAVILDLLHVLPDPALWPHQPIQPPQLLESHKAEIQQIIAQQSTHWQLPEGVVMRKRWLSTLLHYVSQGLSESNASVALPPYLLGWRYATVTQPILARLHDWYG